MPRSLILHIGTMKTGSTTIQHLLSHNRDELAAQGVHYPQGPANHLLLAFMFTSNPGIYSNFGAAIWKGMEPAQRLARYNTQFQTEMSALPPSINRVIVSSEQFSQSVLKQEDMTRLRDYLRTLFDDITVVVYLRRQDAHFASLYAQRLRTGMGRKPSFDVLRRQVENYDYAEMLDNWAEVFGEDAMRPRVFSRDTDKSFDVVDDFLALCDLRDLNKAELATQPRNPSMNLSGQAILRGMIPVLKRIEGREFARSALWKRLAAAVTELMPGQGWRPTRAEAKDFMELFAASNEAVRARWFPGQPSLFSNDFSHLPTAALEEDAEADRLAAYELIARLLPARERPQRDPGAKQAASAEPGEDANAARRVALMAAIRRSRKDVAARVELAQLQIEEGAVHGARYNLEAALKHDPGNAAASALLAQLPANDQADSRPRRRRHRR
jgi:hypothetical protein